MKETWKNLLKVKSIITISLTVIFVVMLACSIFMPVVIPQEFILVYNTVIAFYFGTQYQKGVNANDDSGSSTL